jgi:hypothetical protein
MIDIMHCRMAWVRQGFISISRDGHWSVTFIIPRASVPPVVWTAFSPWHPDNLDAISRRYYGTEGSAPRPVRGTDKVREVLC